jgi:hypothetical protein
MHFNNLIIIFIKILHLYLITSVFIESHVIQTNLLQQDRDEEVKDLIRETIHRMF